jgi:hypothetical protein
MTAIARHLAAVALMCIVAGPLLLSSVSSTMLETLKGFTYPATPAVRQAAAPVTITVPIVPARRNLASLPPSFTTCAEAVAMLNDNPSEGANDLWEGSYTSFAHMTADRPATVSFAHPDWVGVYSASVSSRL